MSTPFAQCLYSLTDTKASDSQQECRVRLMFFTTQIRLTEVRNFFSIHQHFSYPVKQGKSESWHVVLNSDPLIK